MSAIVSLSKLTYLRNLFDFGCNIFFCFSSQQIRKLRRELESSQEKVSNLTTQLTANVCSGFLFLFVY